jgi:MerR HTH family regulatory protein
VGGVGGGAYPSIMDMRPPLTTGDVARELGLSRDRVLQLDGELRPQRTAKGQRLYSPHAVAALRARREAERAARIAKHAERAAHPPRPITITLSMVGGRRFRIRAATVDDVPDAVTALCDLLRREAS